MMYSIPRVSVRLVKENPLQSDGPELLNRIVTSTGSALYVLKNWLAELDREAMCVLSLKTSGEPINVSVCSLGGLNYTSAEPREIMKSVLLSNAASMILAHNHPSGYIKPSCEDIAITDRMVQVGNLFGVSLLDHIIVGTSGQYYSFAENGVLPSPGNNYAKSLSELQIHSCSENELRKIYVECREDIENAINKNYDGMRLGYKALGVLTDNNRNTVNYLTAITIVNNIHDEGFSGETKIWAKDTLNSAEQRVRRGVVFRDEYLINVYPHALNKFVELLRQLEY